MESAALSVVGGLLIGLACGLFFERRSLKSARERAASLDDQLQALRHAFYNLGGSEPERRPALQGDLEDQMYRYAVSNQDAGGEIHLSRIRTHFTAQGFDSPEIDEAIRRLRAAGKIRVNGRQMEIA